MAKVWNLYRFDFARFLLLRPELRIANQASEFALLGDSPDIEAIVVALVDGEIDAVAARHSVLIALCCVGEPVSCPLRFTRTLQMMRRNVRAEIGIEMLSDAIAGQRNIEPWLRPDGKLVGYLTPDETVKVLEALNISELVRGFNPGRRSPRVRRGGLVGGVRTFFRRLFDRGPANDEVSRLLGEMLEEAVSNREGIAVISS